MADKFKVIMGSNYNLDYFDEKVVVPNLSKEGAAKIAQVMNDEFSGPYEIEYYRVEPMDYVLLTSDPNQ